MPNYIFAYLDSPVIQKLHKQKFANATANLRLCKYNGKSPKPICNLIHNSARIHTVQEPFNYVRLAKDRHQSKWYIQVGLVLGELPVMRRSVLEDDDALSKAGTVDGNT